MEKLDEHWSNNTITSIFKVNHRNGRPIGCEEDRTLVYTVTCGLGWRFAIWWDTATPEIDLFFDFHLASPKLSPLKVEARWQSDGSSGAQILEKKCKESANVGNSLPSPETRLKSLEPSDITKSPFLSFQVTLRNIDLDIFRTSYQSPLPRSLQHSIHTGVFIDIRFCVFSRRTQIGQVGSPRALYANSALFQQASTSLDTQLSEAKPSDLGLVQLEPNFPWEEAFTDKYSYESDSDLDDVDDVAGIQADFDSETAGSDGVESTSGIKSTQWHETKKVRPPVHFSSVGRSLLVTDTAFSTWQALILYLYSKEINFSPLKSQKLASRSIAESTSPCSPKSMYRLADKFDMEDLKVLAFKSVQGGLSKENILEESFSRFTSRYPEILEMEVELLTSKYSTLIHSEAFAAKIQSVVEGKIPHSSKAMTLLLRKLAK